ncbi:MAG TPA: hypothetical protein VGC41_15690 [Kofleriaceae bacterium]
MNITVELVWDATASTFRAQWNGKLLAIAPELLDQIRGSVASVEGSYGPGGITITAVGSSYANQRAGAASVLVDQGKAGDALDLLAELSPQVVERDLELLVQRGRARAAVGDVPAACCDLELVLAGDATDHVLHEYGRALARLPAEVAQPLVPSFVARLTGRSSPLGCVDELPASHWTREAIADAIRLHAAATGETAIVKRVLAIANQLGVTDAMLAARVDESEAAADDRESRAARHVAICRQLVDDLDNYERVIAMLDALNGGQAPELAAAIEASFPDLTDRELAELELAVSMPPPVSAAAKLPAPLRRFYALTDGLVPAWSGDQILPCRLIEDGRFADNGEGDHVAITEDGLVDRDGPIACSFYQWLCAYLAAGCSITGAPVILGTWYGY